MGRVSMQIERKSPLFWGFILLLAAWLGGLNLGLVQGSWAAEEDSAVGLSEQGEPESRASDLKPESQPTEQLSLQINLPAARLDLYSNGKFQKSYGVAIGMPKYPTPIRDYNISYIIWNPWWLPPDSEWAQNAEKTPPGPGNPLGAVKMLMEDGIRIHGTNAPRSIGHASSHACLRMKSDDVRELAWRVQQAYSDKRDPELLDKYTKNRRSTFWVELFQQVPVKVEYLQVEAQPDKVLIHPDRYNRGGFQEELQAALASHPEITINKELLAKLKKLRNKGSVEASYQELGEWSRGEAAPATPAVGSSPLKKSAAAL